jgi:hypothetical protein
MSRLTDLQRAEFINQLKTFYNGVIARNQLQSRKLIEVVFSNYYDLGSSASAGELISQLETTINTNVRPEMYNYLADSMESLTKMGVNHTLASTINIMKDSAFDFLDLGDRLALDYLTRVGIDGKRLSDRIWDSETKDAIMEEVYKAIKENKTEYELAKAIEEVVGEGVPMYRIKRIANTELTYAYSHARVDALLEEATYLPNAKAYVEIKLSPAHPKPDICDALVGVYEADKAPLVPFHPGCFLGDTEVFGTDVSAKTVSRYDGDTITITTAEGSSFTCTPNHPMLTVNGFVHADSLKKGDYLVRTGDRFESLLGVKPDSKPVKSLIQDVVISDGVVLSGVPSPVDFHGDGASYEKVDIILSNSKLLNNVKSSTSKFFSKFNFILRLVRFVKLIVLRPFYKFLFRSLNSCHSLVGFLRNGLSKMGLNFIDSLMSFALVSYLNSVSQEEFTNFGSADSKFLMKSKFRDSSLIFTDEIVDIDVSHFNGNVYNLETAGNWYSANSIIAHNCICISRTYLDYKDKKTTSIDNQVKKHSDEDYSVKGTLETASGEVTV